MPLESYDLTADFHQHMEPLHDQIVPLAEELQMPSLIVNAVTLDDKDQGGSCTSCYLPADRTPDFLYAAQIMITHSNHPVVRAMIQTLANMRIHEDEHPNNESD